jgi:hypothetical protein
MATERRRIVTHGQAGAMQAGVEVHQRADGDAMRGCGGRKLMGRPRVVHQRGQAGVRVLRGKRGELLEHRPDELVGEHHIARPRFEAHGGFTHRGGLVARDAALQQQAHDVACLVGLAVRTEPLGRAREREHRVEVALQ